MYFERQFDGEMVTNTIQVAVFFGSRSFQGPTPSEAENCAVGISDARGHFALEGVGEPPRFAFGCSPQ